MAGYRYWRLRITGNYGGPTVCISRLQALAPDKSAIVPINYSASSTFSPANSASNMFNDDPNAYWASANPPGYPVFVTLDYGENVEISYFDITARRDGGDTRTPENYSIEVSDDGTDWGTYWTAPGMPAWANGERRRIDIQTPAQMYKEIRIHIPRTRSASNYALSEVYFRDENGVILTKTSNPRPVYPAAWPHGAEEETTDRASSTYPPQNAFDGDPATFWWGDVTPSAATYIGYRFPLNAPAAATVALQARPTYMTDSPRDFNIQFSGDSGATWTKIYESFDEPPWSASEIRTYNLPPDYDYTVSPIITTARRRFSPCAG